VGSGRRRLRLPVHIKGLCRTFRGRKQNGARNDGNLNPHTFTRIVRDSSPEAAGKQLSNCSDAIRRKKGGTGN
jgi:hypothetical protein